MTPPHIEAAARLIDPDAFERWENSYQSWLAIWRDKSEATERADFAHGTEVKNAIAKATLVWNLARAATLEEAANVADGAKEKCFAKAKKYRDKNKVFDEGLYESAGSEAFQIALAIRALPALGSGHSTKL